jgi:hypothetical protein
MISKLNKSDFIKRLEQNTKVGDPKIKGAPIAVFTMFGKTTKKFYGEYTNSAFRLTKNAILFPTPYIFEGTLKSKDKTTTEISLNIKPIWFGYLWIRIMPALGLILINLILINNGKNIETEVYFLVNTFLLFMFTPILFTIRKKNKLLKDFYRIFEISD